METNLKEYNTRAPWVPPQNQPYAGRLATPQYGGQQLPRPQNPGLAQRTVGQKQRAPEKMPKARAVALASTLKRWLAIASIVGFGTLSGLVALHRVSTTTSQSTQTSSGSSSTNNSKSNSSSQNSNGFFNQQGGNTSGTSSSSTSSSSSSSSSSSAPVSGTHTS